MNRSSEVLYSTYTHQFLYMVISVVMSNYSSSLFVTNWKIKDEMTDAVKRGMLKGFLELDEKLRKIPEVVALI